MCQNQVVQMNCLDRMMVQKIFLSITSCRDQIIRRPSNGMHLKYVSRHQREIGE